MLPSLRSRRWLHLGASDHSDAPPKCFLTAWAVQRRFRPQVHVLEDRNAPGSLLGELFADTLALALLPPASGHDSRGIEDENPRREVLRFEIPRPAEEPPQPATLRGGNDVITTGAGVVSVMGGDDLPFFWAGEPHANSTTDAGFPSNNVLPALAVSTGSGVGVRVSAASFADLAPSVAATAVHIAPPTPGDDTGEPAGDGLRVQNEAEPDPDEPPNTVPIAVDDFGYLDEDTFVVIDVTANDSDVDGDALSVDGWNAEPTNGTLQLNEDGHLVYTPFRDFFSTESFTVNITDGDDTVTSTVTLTVNPVNDAPLAFHDGFSFRNEVADGNPLWPTGDPYGYVSILTGSVLSNDFDVDSVALSVAEWDFAGTVGSVVGDDTSGTFSWTGPSDFVGETSFRYKTTDGADSISDWATVRVWSVAEPLASTRDGPPREINTIEPQAVAVDDVVPVGDADGTDAVMGNDSNAYVAVVATHPSSTRLTSFGFDGAFGFRPGMPRMDDVFTYRLFGPGGATFAIAQGQMTKFDLVIFHGQNGVEVPDGTGKNDPEVIRGAFTVANVNDTDGDNKKDFEDPDGVRASQGPGVDEVDLMLLNVDKPTGFPANPADKITVTVLGGNAGLFRNPYREGKLESSVTLTNADFGMLNSVLLYLEATAPSSKARDIEVQASYGKATDTVRATGIWAHISIPEHMRLEGDTPGTNAEERTYRTFVGNRIGVLLPDGKTPAGLGKPPPYFRQIDVTYKMHMTNAVEFVFTVNPAGVSDPVIKFDLARSIEDFSRYQAGGLISKYKTPDITLPLYRDKTNDDHHTRDEDATPNANLIYSFDIPGFGHDRTQKQVQEQDFSITPIGGGLATIRLIHRMNALEFVRIKLDGGVFDHPEYPERHLNHGNLQGSRASELVAWHSWIDFTWDSTSKTWNRTPNDPLQIPRNDIGPVFKNLNDPSF